MRTRSLLAFIVIVLGSAVSIQAAEPGATCYSAIPIGKEYSEDVTDPKTVWYLAKTFDLPLAVYFVPAKETDPAPEVVMDFACTSGIYSDPILCLLFCKPGGTLADRIPYKAPLEETTVEGKKAYYISMGKTYRDLLLKMGIDYNVDVLVSVTYKSAGFMSIAPDDMFSNCMDGAKFMHLGDEIKVKQTDDTTYRIAPYIQWKSDSIRYIWRGEKECLLSVATVCDFDPLDNGNEKIVQWKKIKPGDTLRVTSVDMNRYINDEEKPSEAGMFFAKFYSQSNGVLKVEKIPIDPPKGDATLLQYDKIVDIPANNASALFALPQSFDVATKFTAKTDHVFRMYIGVGPDFSTNDAIATYQFQASPEGHWIGLFQEEMKALWKKTSDKYLYVRFQCTAKSKFTPTEWTPSDCVAKWSLIPKGESTHTIARGSNGKVYRRFYLNEWLGGDMTLTWDHQTNSCPAFIGNTCDFQPKEGAEHVLDSYTIPKKNGTWTITADKLESWVESVDPDGYLYLLCNPSSQGKMMISTNAPEETDPEIPHTTIHVTCTDESGKNLIVSVSEAQHVTIGGAGGVVDEWDAVPGEAKAISLDTGTYLLKGENENVTIYVP